MKSRYFTPIATAAGGLLASMIFLNGILSRYTNPFFSSLVVHIAGLLASLVLWMAFNRHVNGKLFSLNAPFWSYLGGVTGAFAVVSSNIAVNSPLGLAGSLSCFILGQTITAIVIDHFGFFGTARRRLTVTDGLRVGCILAGSLLLINAGA